MAVRRVVVRTDEQGVWTATCAGLNETGGVRDTSELFVVPSLVGGFITVACSGNFDTSAAVQLQGSIDGGSTWISIGQATAGNPIFTRVWRTPLMRFAVTADGAGDASSITAVLTVGRRQKTPRR